MESNGQVSSSTAIDIHCVLYIISFTPILGNGVEYDRPTELLPLLERPASNDITTTSSQAIPSDIAS